MIDIKAKIHDRFSIEFKVGFVAQNRAGSNNFAINTWFFIPHSLDINALTYDKRQFYSDVKSNVRLITPVFSLNELQDPLCTPAQQLQTAVHHMISNPAAGSLREYEYQIRMYMAIFKSALRDEVLQLQKQAEAGNAELLTIGYCRNLREIAAGYRKLFDVLNAPPVTEELLQPFLFGDEFMSNTMMKQSFRLALFFENNPVQGHKEALSTLKRLIKAEGDYRKEKGFPAVDAHGRKGNEELICRQGLLKKYIESDLYLKAEQRSDSFLAEQVYFSIAAGISMIFATGVAFLIQQKYGNFTIPLFVALVVSYMLKDRIKDLMRYYFAHKLGSRYFDNKIKMSLKDRQIGWSREAADFISGRRVPTEVRRLRSIAPLHDAENRISDEKILLYRKKVQIDRNKLGENSAFELPGINDIMRVYINSFIRKTDDPEVPLFTLDDDGNINKVAGLKVYYINIIMQFRYENNTDYKRFRLACNRAGILKIEELE